MSEKSEQLKARTEAFALAGLQSAAAVIGLEHEAHELACIFSASLRTARMNAKKRREANNP